MCMYGGVCISIVCGYRLTDVCTQLGLLSSANAHMEKVTYPMLDPQELTQ